MLSRFVIDTNVYVSGTIDRSSTPGMAISRAWDQGVLLVSESTWAELQYVFQKSKLARYIAPATSQAFLQQLRDVAETIHIPTPIRACRDPRDDKFLEVAVHGRADILITGDADLLALHPFQGIAILSPASFLAL
jgi:putative PIN family toxin of toxin-antitoxin system